MRQLKQRQVPKSSGSALTAASGEDFPGHLLATARRSFHVALERRALGAAEVHPPVRLAEALPPAEELTGPEDQVASARPGLAPPVDGGVSVRRFAQQLRQIHALPGRTGPGEAHDEVRVMG